MVDISIAELVVYAFVELLTFAMIISSLAKPVPDGKDKSIMRGVYAMPGMIMAAYMATTGTHINLSKLAINGTMVDLNSTVVYNVTQTQFSDITLASPVWMFFHFMIFVVLMVYVWTQMANLLVKH